MERRREITVTSSEVGTDFIIFGLQLGEGEYIRLSTVTWRAVVTLRKEIDPFSEAGWPLAISHAHGCNIPTRSKSTMHIFPLMAKILASCQTSMTDAFVLNHQNEIKFFCKGLP